MDVILLGTAAGGGFPQWNCWCPPCWVARSEPRRAIPRTQSSAAVTADGRRWFLLNASPDVRDQVRRLIPEPFTPPGIRQFMIEGLVLTDAELDHSLGLVLLREAGRLQLTATAAALEVLQEDSRLLPVAGAFAEIRTSTLDLDTPTPLLHGDGSESGLTLTAFVVAGDPPRFARRERPGHTVGLLVEDRQTGGVMAFVPGCGALDEALLARLGRVDLLLFDGTFWTDDEMIRLGLSTRTARQMDHLPVSGPDGSLARLAGLPCRHRVYTHINNSNPMLIEESPERAMVTASGLLVGEDGMRFRL